MRTSSEQSWIQPGIGIWICRLAIALLLLALPVLTAALPQHGGTRNHAMPGAMRAPARGTWNRGHQLQWRRPLGNSLEHLHELPLDQQIRQLQKDKGFQRLPPARQQRIIDRLRWFNSLPAEKQQKVLTRMHHLGELNPDQRRGLEQLFQAWKTFPPERRQAFRRAYRQLNQMPPEQQQQALQSAPYKSQFSPQEIGLLQQAIALHLPQDVVGSRPPQNQQ